MMIPTIHLNGTGRGALGGIRTALDALAEAAPNGRDYYPQGDGAIGKAIKEHLTRVQRLRSVQDELQALAEAIMDGAS